MKNGIVERLSPVLAIGSALSPDMPMVGMVVIPDGGYVKYEDYLHERETVKKLRRQLAKRGRRDARKDPKAQKQDCQPLLVDTEEPTHYDAELRNWTIAKSIWTDQDIASGEIYHDKKGRFLDGRRVYTSAIQRKGKYHDGLFIYTKNSVYKLVGDPYVDSNV